MFNKNIIHYYQHKKDLIAAEANAVKNFKAEIFSIIADSYFGKKGIPKPYFDMDAFSQNRTPIKIELMETDLVLHL